MRAGRQSRIVTPRSLCRPAQPRRAGVEVASGWPRGRFRKVWCRVASFEASTIADASLEIFRGSANNQAATQSGFGSSHSGWRAGGGGTQFNARRIRRITTHIAGIRRAL